jgi:hypothetical protein
LKSCSDGGISHWCARRDDPWERKRHRLPGCWLLLSQPSNRDATLSVRYTFHYHLRLPIGSTSSRSLTRSMQPASAYPPSPSIPSTARGEANVEAKKIHALLSRYRSFRSSLASDRSMSLFTDTNLIDFLQVSCRSEICYYACIYIESRY